MVKSFMDILYQSHNHLENFENSEKYFYKYFETILKFISVQQKKKNNYQRNYS